jgi:3-deoxy-D-manno-octulosonate 8-phosphate phosphatase KdsC-like HAD superfamily phosphatase
MVQRRGSETDPGIAAEDIRRICGDMADWKVIAIVGLKPSISDLELAVAWADHEDEFRQERALEGVAAQVYDILTADEEEEER